MKEKKSVLRLILRGIGLVIVLLGTVAITFQITSFWVKRNHGNVSVVTYEFTESARELKNPNRGFYKIYGFILSDEGEDYESIINQQMCNDNATTLAMIQINLHRYRDGAISQEGLKNIDELFQALEARGKQYLIRFLYDWDGKNEEEEPKNVEIILNHMKQLEGIFKRYENIIFVHQGLFIGNWGEMNGTRYLGNMQELASQLEDVTGNKTFLGVRMPAQWRQITEIGEISEDVLTSSDIAKRLSLFNDGMLGNEGDYGTYGTQSKETVGLRSAWNREEELSFQEELCKFVPNGGEVIAENPLNDFENAVKDLSTMHVTYINRWYDQKVLYKWAETKVSEDGCFDGMDGLTYIERHLGYRLLIKETKALYDFWTDKLSVSITLQNVGFAPMYKKPELYMVLQNEQSKTDYIYQLEDDVRVLSGGSDKDYLFTIQKELSLAGMEAGEYSIFFFMKDADSDMHIQLANEQEQEEYGYLIGVMQIEAGEQILCNMFSE